MKEKQLINSIPLIKILVPLFVGLFIYDIWGGSQNPIVIYATLLGLFTSILIVNVAFKKVASGFATSILLIFTLIVLGYVLIHAHEQSVLPEMPSDTKDFILTIEKTDVISENFIIMEVSARGVQTNTSYQLQLMSTQYDSLLIPGTSIFAQIEPQSIKNKGNPGEFDFKTYLRHQHINCAAWLGKYIYLNHNATYHYYIWNFKQKMLYAYERGGIKEQNKALFFALTSGDKSLISAEQKEDFSNSGIIHMLAVSGLHVGIIYLIISFLVSPLRRHKNLRFLAFIIVCALLILYAFFTGLSPSVLRAVITFILVDLVIMVKRHKLMFNIIILSAIIVAIIDPHYPLHMGFWLSYMAVISIILYMNLFKKLYENKPIYLRKAYDTSLVSVSVQPGTLPLVLFWFGQFPKYFLIANVLVVPVLGIVMIANYLYLCVFACGFGVDQGAGMLNVIGDYVNMIPAFFGGQDDAVIHALRISFAFLLCLYMFFGGLSWLLYFKNLRTLKFLFVTAIIMVGINWFDVFTQSSEEELVIFNNYNGVQMLERRGNACTFYGDSARKVVLDYCNSTNSEITQTNALNEFNYAKGQVFQYVDNPNSKMPELNMKRYLILNCNLYNMNNIDGSVLEVIIPSDVKPYHRKRIIDWCEHNERK